MIRRPLSLAHYLLIMTFIFLLLRPQTDVASRLETPEPYAPLTEKLPSLGRPLDRLEKDALFILDEDLILKKCSIERQEQALLLDMPWHSLFKQPDYMMHPFALARLEKIAQLMKRADHVLQIELYAGDISDTKYSYQDLHMMLSEIMERLRQMPLDPQRMMGLSYMGRAHKHAFDDQGIVLRFRFLPYRSQALSREYAASEDFIGDAPVSSAQQKKNGVRYTTLKERRE